VLKKISYLLQKALEKPPLRQLSDVFTDSGAAGIEMGSLMAKLHSL